jgi:hypothetical protein
MTKLAEIRTYALSKLGKLDKVTPYPADSLAALQGRVPGSMIDMLHTLGLGTWGKGKWQTVEPQSYDGLLQQTLRGDPDFSAGDCTVFAILGFGDLTCWHRRFGIVNIRVLPNTLSAPSFYDNGPEDAEQAALLNFMSIHLTAGDYYDKYAGDGKGLFARLVKAHGPLAPGQIFAPRLHPAIGGAVTVENFRPASAPEATALLHQMEPFVFMDHRKPRAVEVRMIGRQ